MDYCIIGSSQQLNNNKELIQRIASNTYSIAINYACCDFKTNVLAFLDYYKECFNIYKEHSNNYDFAITSKKNKDFIPEDYNCEYYKIVSGLNLEKDKLGACGFTTTVALNYIAKMDAGANVYLIGVDHSLDGSYEHYSNKHYENKNIKKDVSIQKQTRDFIESINKQNLLNIYQTDKNSIGWELPYIELKEVLNDKYS